MPQITKQQLVKELKLANEQIKHLGDSLAQSTSLVQTQDVMVQNLQVLNDKLIDIIHSFAKGKSDAQPS